MPGPAGRALADWLAWLGALPRPVVLLEGTRALPEADCPKLAAVAALLARALPRALFRSGNAEGSDRAFSEGIAAVDPKRLQLVLPYAGHRSRMIPGGAYPVSLSQLATDETRLVAETTEAASPRYAPLLAKNRASAALKAKSAYLLRDTLKVAGCERLDLDPAAAALFYVNPQDPEGGGTGHTLRVCRSLAVPFLDQGGWMPWAEKL